MVYGWRTTKTETGFRWEVYTTGYQTPTVILQSGVRPTRAQAEGRAKKWVLYYRRSVKLAA